MQIGLQATSSSWTRHYANRGAGYEFKLDPPLSSLPTRNLPFTLAWTLGSDSTECGKASDGKASDDKASEPPPQTSCRHQATRGSANPSGQCEAESCPITSTPKGSVTLTIASPPTLARTWLARCTYQILRVLERQP